jgi:V/A-type H+/Na+-transporting ATPase subunit I
MIKPERMAKMQVICTRKHLRKVIREFHAMKVLHIVDHKKSELDIGRPLEDAATMSETLVKIRAIITFLNIDPKLKPNEEEFEKFVNRRGLTDLQSIGKATQKVYEEIIEKLNAEKALETELLAKNRLFEELEMMHALGISPSLFRQSSAIAGFFGTVQDAGRLEQLKYELRKITEMIEIASARSSGRDNKGIIAVFTDTEHKALVQQALSSSGFAEIKPEPGLKGTASELRKECSEKIEQLEAKKKALREHIGKFGSTWGNFLAINEKRLSKEIEKSEAPMRFAETRSTSIITGWVPEKSYEQLAMRLNELTQGKMVIEKLECHDESEVPIKLKHKQPVKSFEFFMNLYSLPNYMELDPTLFMFITFPIFFGFMLGDVGYGFITLILFLYLRSKMGPGARFLLNAMILCSISSMVFGVAFGEYLGFEKFGEHEIPRLLSRAEEINTLLIISVIIGVFHVNIGFIAGFINEMHHGFKKALLAKGSWMIIEIGTALLALSLLNILALHWAIGAAVAVTGVVMLYFGEGVNGLVELPTIASHSMSYARLMAVGLASVFLAILVNDYGVEFIHEGGWMIVAGISILLIGHVFNIALGIIGPFLHSLRLHYVEFFTKFYRGGGKKYSPFGASDE